MAINFPTNPVLNEEYTFDTKTWIWNGTAWNLKQNQPNVLLDLIKTVDGSGSGLDADLLDGSHASSFYSTSTPLISSVTGTAPIVSSGGTTPAISISAATTSAAGSMSSADKTKLDGIAAGATNVTNTNQLTNGAGFITSSGTAANVSGTVAVANGGTGQTTYTNGQLLIGNTTGNTLAKATLTQGTGISITNGAGAITVTNSAPDQTVALTGAGGTSITGTYPNFTITSTNTTYSLATSTVLGLIELGSDTQQTVAANAVTATASRSYALQVNAAGQGVVNVPWTDSGGTVSSVSWNGGIVTVTNPTTTPAFTIAGTSGGIPYFSSGTTWATSAALTANFLVIGGGAGAAPTTTTTGSGVLTALGNAVNGAAGFITGQGTVTLTNKTLTAPTMTGAVLNDGYTEEVFAVSGTTPALSPTNGSIQTWTLSANSTPTQGTWANGQSITLMIDDGAGFTITWTSLGVTWLSGGGTAPTLSTTGFTTISLWEVGNVTYGARVGN